MFSLYLFIESNGSFLFISFYRWLLYNRQIGIDRSYFNFYEFRNESITKHFWPRILHNLYKMRDSIVISIGEVANMVNVYNVSDKKNHIGRKTHKLDTIGSIECLWYNGFYSIWYTANFFKILLVRRKIKSVSYRRSCWARKKMQDTIYSFLQFICSFIIRARFVQESWINELKNYQINKLAN